jgi:hypothetical protein
MFFIFQSHISLITHHSSLITHHSSLITHHSSLITHHSSLITHHSSLITYPAEPNKTLQPSHTSTAIANNSRCLTRQYARKILAVTAKEVDAMVA